MTTHPSKSLLLFLNKSEFAAIASAGMTECHHMTNRQLLYGWLATLTGYRCLSIHKRAAGGLFFFKLKQHKLDTTLAQSDLMILRAFAFLLIANPSSFQHAAAKAKENFTH